MEFVYGQYKRIKFNFIQILDSDENTEVDTDYWSETVVLTPLSSNGGFQSGISRLLAIYEVQFSGIENSMKRKV